MKSILAPLAIAAVTLSAPALAAAEDHAIVELKLAPLALVSSYPSYGMGGEIGVRVTKRLWITTGTEFLAFRQDVPNDDGLHVQRVDLFTLLPGIRVYSSPGAESSWFAGTGFAYVRWKATLVDARAERSPKPFHAVDFPLVTVGHEFRLNFGLTIKLSISVAPRIAYEGNHRDYAIPTDDASDAPPSHFFAAIHDTLNTFADISMGLRF